MKQVFTLLALSVALFFTSCKKEPKDELIGTSWTFYGTDTYETISFYKGDEVKVKGELAGIDYTAEGTYSFNKPNITITIGSQFLYGEVEGNVMTLESANYPKVIYLKD